MRVTRAEAKERNRRALLDAAREVVARDGHRAKLEEITERAGLTTGAVYSVFGSKDGLLIALVVDYFGPHHERLAGTLAPELDLGAAVAAFARYYRRLCDDPDAPAHLAFETSLYDIAMRDPGLRAKLAQAEAEHEGRIVAMFAGRRTGGDPVTERQARRLARALKALVGGLAQSVIMGLPDSGSEQYFADAAQALAVPAVLGPP